MRNWCAVASLMVLGCCVGSELAAQVGGNRLISEQEARRHGLTRAWFAQADLDSSRDRIETMRLHDGLLIVQSRQGVIQLLDAETGRSFWSVHVGSPGSYTSAPGLNEKFVVVTNGSTLYVYDRETGSLIWEKPVVRSPGAGVAISGKYACLVTTSGVLELHDLEDKTHPTWHYNSGGHGFVQPVSVGNSVGWGTELGLFYVLDTDRLRLRFPPPRARDEIVAAPGYGPPYFYVGSLDGYLYKIHQRSGAVEQLFSAGDPIECRPLLADGLVFFNTRHGELYCVVADMKLRQYHTKPAPQEAEDDGKDAAEADQRVPEEAGRQLWSTRGIYRLLALTPTRVYGRDKEGRLRILRRDTGALVGVVPTEHLALSVTNHATDRIYLATPSGLIQCLHEPALEQPLQYVMTEEVKKAPAKIEQGEVEEAAVADKPRAVEDLFGGGAAAGQDPFGGAGDGGDAADDKDGGDDPFGGGGDNADADDNPFG